jgi:hypothetical protein
MRVILLLALVVLGNSIYCYSQCLTPTVNTSCVNPYACATYDPLFIPGGGAFAAGYTQV